MDKEKSSMVVERKGGGAPYCGSLARENGTHHCVKKLELELVQDHLRCFRVRGHIPC